MKTTESRARRLLPSFWQEMMVAVTCGSNRVGKKVSDL